MQRPDPRSAKNTNPPTELGILARMALALTDWTERWVPDAFVFALLATLIVIVAGVASTPSRLPQVIDSWGKGFWELIPFTLQMALIIITGYVLATSQPVGRVIRRVAAWPTTPRNAVALVAFFAMASSWFNWGFSLIFSAVLAKEIARRVEGVDYRALAAASFLGLGSVWAQGLSGSAALQMATPGALQPQIREIVAHNGLIVLIGGTYLVRYFMQAGEPLNAINLNIVNFTFLLLGFLLHKTPARLMHAVQGATPAVWGVILQFPFYAGIAGIITSTHLN